ncbi:hypothetical protein [Bradyrhizobium elkanii]|uniref:hypothetical protein n=1 Tax=Bradyrhizobium elkanii TaxID=29448 RepID=UPI003D242126
MFSKLSSSTRVVIGSTLFALASSVFLYTLSGAPIDRSIRGKFRWWQLNAYVAVVKYPLDKLKSAKLYEDDRLLGPPNSDPQDISVKGSGLYRLYLSNNESAPTLMFSSSDNTDPRTNGRKYRLE